MSHVPIEPDKLDWFSFVAAQEGRGLQETVPLSHYFQGFRYQRGSGMLGSIARFLMPIAKNIANTAKQEGIAAGAKILGDLTEGKNIKESLMEHSKEGMQNLAQKLQQCGKGRTKKRTPIKRRRRDQLDFF